VHSTIQSTWTLAHGYAFFVAVPVGLAIHTKPETPESILSKSSHPSTVDSKIAFVRVTHSRFQLYRHGAGSPYLATLQTIVKLPGLPMDPCDGNLLNLNLDELIFFDRIHRFLRSTVSTSTTHNLDWRDPIVHSRHVTIYQYMVRPNFD
jgi:hypothetical protein